MHALARDRDLAASRVAFAAVACDAVNGGTASIAGANGRASCDRA